MLRLVVFAVILAIGYRVVPPAWRDYEFLTVCGLALLPSLLSNVLQGQVKNRLDAWALGQKLRLVGFELFVFRKGPFTWTAGDAQRVLRIAAKDSHGQIQRGWVCVGSWWLGLLSSRIQVVWDKLPGPG